MTMEEILGISPIIPVVTLDSEESAVPLAETLLEAGIGVVEITLRTAAALKAVEAVKGRVPDMVVGVGTLWQGTELKRAIGAGADFGVSPGATDALLEAVAASGLPFLPGAQTASEIADRAVHGYRAVKFFPAESAGGIPALRALVQVFPHVQFCPTGGIGPDAARAYREIPNVPTVGGSWITPGALLAARDWAAIGQLARQALGP